MILYTRRIQFWGHKLQFFFGQNPEKNMKYKIILPKMCSVHREISFGNSSQNFLGQSANFCSFAFQINFLTNIFAQCDWK